MKTRTDFVTNSSSSSFILAFSSQKEGQEKIQSLTTQYGSDYIDALLDDFLSTTPIDPDKFFEFIKEDLENEADLEMIYGEGNWWSSNKNTFEHRWMQEHPDAKYGDFYDSEEYKAENKRLVQKYYNEILEKIKKNQYVVMLEYEDHSIVGAALENRILPNCDFVVYSFSHH